MIIANGVPKSGTTFLVTYLQACGLQLEPGGLMTDHGRRLTMRGGKPWGAVRSLSEVMAHTDNDRVIGAHVSASAASLSPHKVAFIYRHPRNILVSWARWRAVGLDWTRARSQPGPVAIQGQITKSAEVRAIVRRMRDFLPWVERATVSVRFEDFMERPMETAAPMCAALGIECADPEKVTGDAAPWVTMSYRGTWSGKLSDWREVWDARCERVWTSAGGPEIESLYGYEGETA